MSIKKLFFTGGMLFLFLMPITAKSQAQNTVSPLPIPRFVIKDSSKTPQTNKLPELLKRDSTAIDSTTQKKTENEAFSSIYQRRRFDNLKRPSLVTRQSTAAEITKPGKDIQPIDHEADSIRGAVGRVSVEAIAIFSQSGDIDNRPENILAADTSAIPMLDDPQKVGTEKSRFTELRSREIPSKKVSDKSQIPNELSIEQGLDSLDIYVKAEAKNNFTAPNDVPDFEMATTKEDVSHSRATQNTNTIQTDKNLYTLMNGFTDLPFEIQTGLAFTLFAIVLIFSFPLSRARIYFMLGWYSRAINICEKILSKQPYRINLYRILAYAYFSTDSNHEKAIQAYEKVLVLKLDFRYKKNIANILADRYLKENRIDAFAIEILESILGAELVKNTFHSKLAA